MTGNEPPVSRPESGTSTWVLRARDLVLGYGRGAVLRGVNLEIRPGESWFLIGPNGSGKTTLLRAVLGLLTPQSGCLELAPRLARRARVGFVPQHLQLAASLPTTLWEFVWLGLVGSDLARSDREPAIRAALECVGLRGRERSDLRWLSGGQRRRALLARALVRRPSLLLLDEPTEGLDVAAQEAFLATLEQLQKREALTLMFVTHELRLAVRHASHVALFDRGRVLAGEAPQVLRRGEIERVFGVRAEAFLPPAPPGAPSPGVTP